MTLKPKKIFVAVTNDISTDYRVHKISSYLVEAGFEVIVYGRVLPNTIPVNRAYEIIRKKHFFNTNFWFYAEYNIRLFFFVLFKRFNCILSNDLDTLPGCFFISKLKNIDLVYDSHELFSEGPELQDRKFVQSFWRKLEDFFLPKVKKSYTVSQSIADFYHKKYKNKMGVIRNVPPKNSHFLLKNTHFPTVKKTILYQGVLNPGRGIKPMICALKYLKDLDLVIIGYGKVEEDLKSFVVKEKMEDRVHFLGRIDRDMLVNYTKLATLGMVLEEPLGLSFTFSLPNKLFDFIHAEIPIIAGNMPEISRIINQYKVGVIVEDYSPEKIAEKINELLDDQTLMATIKKNQQKTKEILCWEAEAKKLDTYFK
jgi:glycosyltransferase involved in cell wall biosynthesis